LSGVVEDLRSETICLTQILGFYMNRLVVMNTGQVMWARLARFFMLCGFWDVLIVGKGYDLIVVVIIEW